MPLPGGHWGGNGVCTGGGGVKGADSGQLGIHMKNEDGLLESTLENSRQSIADNRTWVQVNGTQVSTTLGYQMPLPGGYWGGNGGGIKHQPDPQDDQMSCWHAVEPCLMTRCLHRGWVGGIEEAWGCQGVLGYDIWKMKMVYCRVLLKTQDGLLNIADNRTWAQVSETQVSTTLGHQMPLPWGIGSDGVGVHLTKHQPDP